MKHQGKRAQGSGTLEKNWPGNLMFGLLYPAVLGTFFYSLLPEMLQCLREPLHVDLPQGTKLGLSFLLIVHFLVDFYFTQQVALETKRYYPAGTFALDLCVVLALFVAYDTIHLDDRSEPEIRWAAGAMFFAYVLFRIWGRQMESAIGKRLALRYYEIGSAAAFLLIALFWPKAYAFAVALLGSTLLMWFIGGPIVLEFHHSQTKSTRQT